MHAPVLTAEKARSRLNAGMTDQPRAGGLVDVEGEEIVMASFARERPPFGLLLSTFLVCSYCCLGSAQQRPEDGVAHQQLGYRFLVSQQFDQAIAELREALRLDPNVPETHNDLGLALVGKGDLDGACEEFRAAVRLSPHYAEARAN